MNDETNESEVWHRPFTLKQSLSWAKHNCTPKGVERLRSRATVARLVEEVEKLQALLAEINNDVKSCYYVSYRVTQLIDTYFAEIDKS